MMLLPIEYTHTQSTGPGCDVHVNGHILGINTVGKVKSGSTWVLERQKSCKKTPANEQKKICVF